MALGFLVSLLAGGLSACTTLSLSQQPEPALATVSPSPVAANDELLGPPHNYTDLWERIRAGYGLPELDSPLVTKHERWFAQNPAYFKRLTTRARLYLYFIVEEVEKRKMPLEIALLPAIESAYRPHAYSRARAVGLWQFISSTGRRYGLERNWWYDGRRDVTEATKAALDFLEKLYTDFDGDWHLALAAYNAGERRIQGAQGYNRRRGRPTDYIYLRTLKPETRNYVPKLLALAKIIADPAKYGLTLDEMPNEPYFARVEIGSQIDLGVAANLAGISLGDLYDINPGFKRWATAPDGPHYLLVPAEKRDALIEALASLPDKDRIRWRRHYVRQGQTLGAIAQRYGVSVGSIKKANRLRGTRIRADSSLLIPISSRRISARHANVTRPVKRKPRILPPPKDAIKVVHKVKSGETLWAIARRYKVFMREIAGWNGLRLRGLLRPGQKLKVWVNPAYSPAAALTRIAPKT